MQLDHKLQQVVQAQLADHEGRKRDLNRCHGDFGTLGDDMVVPGVPLISQILLFTLKIVADMRSVTSLCPGLE